jgi:Skp family chaperone for outer membrane proteins
VKYWLAIAVLVLSGSVASAQEGIKIGFIDIQRVISESQAGKRAKERFQAQVKKAEADVVKERQDLEKLRADSSLITRGALSICNARCLTISRSCSKKITR